MILSPLAKQEIAIKMDVDVNNIIFVSPSVSLRNGYDKAHRNAKHMYLLPGTHVLSGKGVNPTDSSGGGGGGGGYMDAYRKAKGIETLWCGNRKHTVVREHYLEIEEPMIICGAGKGKTFVKGSGFWIKGKKEENGKNGKNEEVGKGKRFKLMDMTVQKTQDSGLLSHSSAFFECVNVHFDGCGTTGVKVIATKGKLTNCHVTGCGHSGIYSGLDSTIEIEGEETMIENNVLRKVKKNKNNKDTRNTDERYGLDAATTTSFIHILSPLTKASISRNNRNDLNYGGKGAQNIKAAAVVSASVVSSPTSTTIALTPGCNLGMGSLVAVTGHTGNAANIAMNQIYTVAAEGNGWAVLRGVDMALGTYNTGTIKVAVVNEGD